MSDIAKKHWTEFLSEVGKPLLRRGYIQLDRLAEIRRYELELRLLQIKFDETERELTSIAKSDWSFEEINKAKSKALESCTM